MSPSPSSPSPGWFRQHFNEDYRTLYSGRTEEQAEREVDFVFEQLEITPDDRVLDLCCGHGRHLRAIASRGVPVVGVDLSDALLRQAPTGPGIELVCADMRELPFPVGDQSGAGFSVLVNFFTSFGYFDSDHENERAAREMARVLRRDGRFSIDLMNPSHVVGSLVPRSQRTAGPFELVEERSFDAARRRIEKHIDLLDRRDDSRRRYVESVRVYEEDEIRSLLSGVGLEVDRVFGEFADVPPSADRPRLLLMGHKR